MLVCFLKKLSLEFADLGKNSIKLTVDQKKSNRSKLEPKTEAANELGYSVFVWPNHNLNQRIAPNISIVYELWRHDKYGRLRVQLTTSYCTKPKNPFAPLFTTLPYLQSSPSHLRSEYKHMKYVCVCNSCLAEYSFVFDLFTRRPSLFYPGIH